MKTRNIFALIGMSLAMVVGTVAVLGITKGETQVKEASAAVNYAANTAGQTMYLDLNNYKDWADNGANFALYFYNSDSDNQWTALNAHSQINNYVYKFTVPGSTNKTWNNVIAVRLNSSATSANWDSKWNQTQNLSITGNCITISGWNSSGAVTTMYGLKSGETLYLDANNATSFKNTYVYFFDALDGSGAQWSATIAQDVHEASNSNISEVIVPGTNKIFYSVIAVKNSTPSFEGEEGQTHDHFCGSRVESDVQNAVVIKSDTWTDWENSYHISGEQRALWYGTYFINQTNTACSSKVAPTSSVWTGLSEEFGHMGNESQQVLIDADTSKFGSDSYETYEEAMRRYDLIVSQRGVTGFIGRSPLQSNVMVILKKSDNAGMIIVVSVSLVAISSVGVYFFLKRRKEVA